MKLGKSQRSYGMSIKAPAEINEAKLCNSGTVSDLFSAFLVSTYNYLNNFFVQNRSHLFCGIRIKIVETVTICNTQINTEILA